PSILLLDLSLVISLHFILQPLAPISTFFPYTTLFRSLHNFLMVVFWELLSLKILLSKEHANHLPPSYNINFGPILINTFISIPIINVVKILDLTARACTLA